MWHCTKVSAGCENCFAERLNVRFGGPPFLPGADTLRLDETILTNPRRWRRPRRIFVQSMGDLFHEDVPDDWIDRIVGAMLQARHELRRPDGTMVAVRVKRVRERPELDGQTWTEYPAWP
jgi:protein gp37